MSMDKNITISIEKLKKMNIEQSHNSDTLVVELVKIAIIFQLSDIVEIAEFLIGYARGLRNSNAINRFDIVGNENQSWELLLNKSTPLGLFTSLNQAEDAKILAERVFSS